MTRRAASIRRRRDAPWRASSRCRRCIAGRSTLRPWQDVVNEFATEEDMRKADRGYFNQLVTDICGGSEALDTALAGWMDRKPTELDPVERAVLWVGAHELRPRPTCRIAWSSTKPSASPNASAPPTATSSSTRCWMPPPVSCARSNTEIVDAARRRFERRWQWACSPCHEANSSSSASTSRASARERAGRAHRRRRRRRRAHAALVARAGGRSRTRWSKACTFPVGSPPASIGHRAFAVNLSDLAAMGAEPAWALLALTIPRSDEAWLAQFARAAGDLCRKHGVALVGGDTTRGPLSITVTLIGIVPIGVALERERRPGRATRSSSPDRRAMRPRVSRSSRAACTWPIRCRAQILRDRFLFPDAALRHRCCAAGPRERLHRRFRWPGRRSREALRRERLRGRGGRGGAAGVRAAARRGRARAGARIRADGRRRLRIAVHCPARATRRHDQCRRARTGSGDANRQPRGRERASESSRAAV